MKKQTKTIDIKQYFDYVRTLSLKYISVYPNFVEDIQQEGYIGLIKAGRSYNPNHLAQASFKTYAISRIKWRMTNYINKMARKGMTGRGFSPDFVPINGGGNEKEEMEISGGNFEKLYHTIDYFEKITKDVSKFKKMVLELYYFYGYSKMEIGQMVKRSRERIRQIIKETEEELKEIL